MEYLGTCHCNAVGFRFRTEIRPEDWSVRACQCSFCRAHDALSTSDPDGELEFTAKDGSLLQRYRFGLGTADFLALDFCAQRGGIRKCNCIHNDVGSHMRSERLSCILHHGSGLPWCKMQLR